MSGGTMNGLVVKDETPIPVEQGVWYKNVTLWTNVVTIAVLIANAAFGIPIDPKIQAAILGIINIILQVPRMAITQAKAMAHNRIIRARMIQTP